MSSNVTQFETATIHTVDHIAALVLCMLRTFESNGRPIQLMSKTWDPADAYKQVPLGDTAYDLNFYLVVYCRFRAALSLHWGNCGMCNGFNPHRQKRSGS